MNKEKKTENSRTEKSSDKASPNVPRSNAAAVNVRFILAANVGGGGRGGESKIRCGTGRAQVFTRTTPGSPTARTLNAPRYNVKQCAVPRPASSLIVTDPLSRADETCPPLVGNSREEGCSRCEGRDTVNRKREKENERYGRIKRQG